MTARRTFRRRAREVCSRFGAADGSQIVEFAVSLPLLMVLAVGIFDFGNAYNLKQKLTNAAREGARLGASQPTNDLSSAPPTSILAVRDVVDNYLQAARINDCGLQSATATAVGAASPWAWTFSSSCGAAIGNLVLIVNRGNVVTSAVVTAGNPVKVLTTQVTVQYPYRWQFNRVASLLGATGFAGTSQITAVAMMENQN